MGTVQVVGGTGTLVEVADWFDRIKIKSQNGSKLLTTLYNDTNLFNYNLIESQKLRKLKSVGLVDNDWSVDSTVRSASDVVTVYLPLIGSVFDLSDLYFENSVGDLNLEFYPTPSGIIQTGDGATISCQGMELIAETEILPPKDQETHLAHYSKSISSCRFLEPIENHFYSYQMNNGQEYKLVISLFLFVHLGRIPRLLVAIIPTLILVLMVL